VRRRVSLDVPAAETSARNVSATNRPMATELRRSPPMRPVPKMHLGEVSPHGQAGPRGVPAPSAIRAEGGSSPSTLARMRPSAEPAANACYEKLRATRRPPPSPSTK
jgi:hypothetical protein